MAFASVSSIVIGSLWLLGNLAQVLLFMAKFDDPAQRIYDASALLGFWKWAGPIIGIIAGAVVLLAGVDGARKRPTGRRSLRNAVYLVLGWWLIGTALWGTLGLQVLDEWADGGRASKFNAHAGYGSTLFRDPSSVKMELLASLVFSSLVTLAWGITTLRLISTRSRKIANARSAHAQSTMPPPIPLPVEGHPVVSVVPELSYQPRAAAADAKRRLPLQASPGLVKTLFLIAIVVGVLSAISDGQKSWTDYSSLGKFSGRGLTRFVQWNRDERIEVGLLALTTLAGLGLAIGGVLGVLRNAAGWVMIFIAVTLLLLVALIGVRIELPSVLLALISKPEYSYSSYAPVLTPSWVPLVTMLQNLARSAVFPIICFVAFSRRASSDGVSLSQI